MGKRRLVLAVMFSGVLSAGAVGVAPSAFAGGPWHPVQCVETSPGVWAAPPGTPPPPSTGPCSTTDPTSGQTYPYYVVTCDPSKFKGTAYDGILWQRGNTTGYQCVTT